MRQIRLTMMRALLIMLAATISFAMLLPSASFAYADEPAEVPAQPTLSTQPAGWFTFEGDAQSRTVENTGTWAADYNGTLDEGNEIQQRDGKSEGFRGLLHFSPKANNTAKGMYLKGTHPLNARNQDFSISFWMKRAVGNSERYVVLQQDGSAPTMMNIEKNGQLSLFMDRKTRNITPVPNGEERETGEWEHIVLTKQNNGDQAHVAVYQNGSVAGEVDIPLSGLSDANTGLYLGRHKNQREGTGQFTGDIAEFGMFDSAISQDDVTALYLHRKASIMAAIAARENVPITDAEAVTLNINPENKLRNLDSATFGINHRYGFNGYGTFDSETMQINPKFAELYDTAGFGSLRYPGGTISNLFDWKRSIGPKENRVPQIHGFYNNPNQHGLPVNFGLTEVGTFAQEHHSEIVYVYSLGRGDASDAADLIEYLNAPLGSNPNGGVAWAKQRAANGHSDPYNVRYFEIGNEMWQGGTDGNTSQMYWTPQVPGGALEGYTNGGLATFNKQYAVREGDWNVTASRSDGTANQKFLMRYALLPREQATGSVDTSFEAVVPSSVHVFVNDQEWSVVDDLSNASADDTVVQLNKYDGTLLFGDGTHGRIPDQGQQVKVSYQVQRDGFVQIVQSMRSTFTQVNEARTQANLPAIDAKIYTSFETTSFVDKMHSLGLDSLYDGMTIHPYSGTPAGGGKSRDGRRTFYFDALAKEETSATKVRNHVAHMRQFDPAKSPAVSEFGIFRSTDPMLRSQVGAIYTARAMIDYLKAGSPYVQRHTLSDWYSSGADSLGPTQQAVIQVVPLAEGEGKAAGNTATGEGRFDYFATPSARVYELLHGNVGTQITEATFSANRTLQSNVTALSSMVSTDDSSNRYVLLVNADPDTNAPVHIVQPEGFENWTMTTRVLSASHFWDENTLANPNAVVVRETETETLTGENATADVTVPAASVMMVRLVPEKKTDPEPEPKPDPTIALKRGENVISSIKQGEQLTVHASGLPKSSETTIMLHSVPILLGTVRSDSDGNIAADVTIPADAEVGMHEIVVESGNVTLRADLEVKAAATDSGTQTDDKSTGDKGTQTDENNPSDSSTQTDGTGAESESTGTQTDDTSTAPEGTHKENSGGSDNSDGNGASTRDVATQTEENRQDGNNTNPDNIAASDSAEDSKHEQKGWKIPKKTESSSATAKAEKPQLASTGSHTDFMMIAAGLLLLSGIAALALRKLLTR